MPYLTGNAPSGRCVLTIILPYDDSIRLAASGALLDLTKSHNWESWGDSTPEDYANLLMDAWQTLNFECYPRLTDANGDYILDDDGNYLTA